MFERSYSWKVGGTSTVRTSRLLKNFQHKYHKNQISLTPQNLIMLLLSHSYLLFLIFISQCPITHCNSSSTVNALSRTVICSACSCNPNSVATLSDLFESFSDSHHDASFHCKSFCLLGILRGWYRGLNGG